MSVFYDTAFLTIRFVQEEHTMSTTLGIPTKGSTELSFFVDLGWDDIIARAAMTDGLGLKEIVG